MEWAELDLDAAEWRIPAAKMKMRDEHVVPLAEQAVAILRDLQPLTGPDPNRPTRIARYCFPSLRSGTEPMSENTVNAALRRLGFDKVTMTGHGFRAMASTRLNELGWAPDVIERQLAHAERNAVRAAYNRAQYMKERRLMMSSWADYLETLRADTSKVARISETNSTGITWRGRCSISASSGETRIKGRAVLSQCARILLASNSESGCGESTICSSVPSS